MPVAGLMRKVHGEVAGSRVVPQSHVKLRRLNSSTRVCSPWHAIEHE